MTHHTRQRLIQLLIAALLFASGVGTGVALTIIGISRVTSRLFMNETPVGVRHTLIRRALERRLDLDDAERSALDEILARYEAPHEELLAAHRARMKPLRERAFKEIREKLRPENQRELDTFRDELEARASRRDP